MEYNLLTLAKLLKLFPGEVAVLPACVERMAASVGLTPGQFSTHCLTNGKLRDYLGHVVRTVADTPEGREVAAEVLRAAG